MGRLVMIISGAMTAFILALSAGAIYAYQSMAAPATATQQQSAPVGTTLQLAAVATPTVVPNVSPQDAASLAGKFISRTDMYSVELADYQGAQSYKVTFSSGDVVFVGLQGQILGSQLPPPPVLVTTSGTAPRRSGGGGGSGASSSGEHEQEGGGD